MIIDISKVENPSDCPLYFFDANIWIAILKNNNTGKLESRLQPYIDFFEAIVNVNSLPEKQTKKLPFLPKIAMTSMLLSEIINAYLRNVAMPDFLNCKPREKSLKKEYRKPNYTDYDKQIKHIISDIKSFEDSSILELIDDDFKGLGMMKSLDKLNRTLDFNDLYYYELLKKNNIPIVTDDGDFNFSDLTIFTIN